MSKDHHRISPAASFLDVGVQVREIAGDASAPVFHLRMIDRRLWVERRLFLHDRGEWTMYVAFDDSAAFNKWCDADPAVVGRPNLHQRLKRAADDALFRHGSPAIF